MNDLPDNELFSAYLDGELTAAERQQLEQLLAASPAARQWLEELRAVSNTLHALPREKLGEDLVPRVLRLAERRMLTGDQPDVASVEAAPTPLARSLVRRFTRPRILVWLAITVVFVVMIRVNELHQGGPAVHAPQEVALAPTEQRAPLPPSSIEAYPFAKPAAATSAPAKSAPVATKQKQPVAGVDKKSPVAEKSSAEVSGGSGRDGKPAAIVAENMKRMQRGTDETGKENEKIRMSPVQTKPDEAVMVVDCDVSPEAVKKQTFDRLLVSNGIVWQQGNVAEDRGGASVLPQPRPTASPAPASGPAIAKAAKQPASKATSDKLIVATPALVAHKEERPAELQVQQPSAVAGRNVQPPSDEGALDVIYVEATAAQIEATLKGLAAQPDAFPSLYVQSAPGETSQQPFRQYNRVVGSQLALTVGNENGSNVTPAESPSAKTAEYGSAARDSRLLQAGTGRAAPQGVFAPPTEEKGVTVPSQLAIRHALQEAPQNQTSSRAFAQRVQLDASRRVDDREATKFQIAGSEAKPTKQAKPAKQASSSAKASPTDALQQTERRAVQQYVQNQPAEPNAPTQRVVFVLRVRAQAAFPAAPPANQAERSQKAAEPAAASPPQK
jgi:anti-sigma factor RsiW